MALRQWVMAAHLLALVLLLSCAACSEKGKPVPRLDIKFEPIGWSEKSGGVYTYRNQMVADLLHNYRWCGVTKDSVISRLGSPDDTEEGSLSYTYERKRSLGGLATSIEAVVFEISPDGTVRKARLNDGSWD